MIDVTFTTYQVLPNTVEEYNALDVENRIQRLCAEEFLPHTSNNDVWYHYTSLSCLPQMIDKHSLGIIKLWATHVDYVNDADEIKYGVDVISNAFKDKFSSKKIEDAYRNNTFITCFSEESDNISMWNTYAEKGKGIALGFKPFITGAQTTNVVRAIYKGTAQDIAWQKRIVELSESNNKLDKASFLLNVAYLPFAYKNKCFKYEKEIRIFTISHIKEADFHTRDGILIPHVVIPIPIEFLSEIKIGPTANQEKVRRSIELFLKAHEMKDVKITYSQQPLQN